MWEYSKIKLIIWDLDDTFWKGTLSEGKIDEDSTAINLVKQMTERGIVHSICSKNDMLPVLSKLEEMGMKAYFVFPSINWEPKGERIKQIISDMKLRAENVLFIDDNQMNLEEAIYYNQGIMTALPKEIEPLLHRTLETEVTDPKRKRLLSYQVLEQKREAKEASSSNEDFLFQSNIKVQEIRDCLPLLDRIEELVARTNQLNYTKKRSTKDEIRDILKNKAYQCAAITVQDNYGDYGIVGFYACKEHVLEHFLFSCRTLGMGVEQYVYAKLNFPTLEVVGDIASPLTHEPCQPYINQEKERIEIGKQSLTETGNTSKVLFKGPCDLDAIFSYIEENEKIDSEFTYVSKRTGVTIEQISHTAHIVQSLTLTKEQKQVLLQELPFADENMYSDKMFTGDYDVVCLSVLVDANLGLYRRKETGEEIAFVQDYYPLTNQENWEAYISGEIYTSGCTFTKEFLQEFADKYQYVGRAAPEKTIENLHFIREHLPKNTLLLLLLGSELYYEKNTYKAYEDRHLRHAEWNTLCRKFAKETNNTVCVDVNRFIKGQESFFDHLNHYVPSVYYELSSEIVRMVNAHTGHAMKEKSKTYVWIQNIKSPLRKVKRFLRNMLKRRTS